MSGGALVLVWLGMAEARAAQEPALESWARSRAVSLEEIATDPGLPAAGHDDALAQRVEDQLAEARAGSFAMDVAPALAALDAAEAALREHPELPEAAWLLAEVWQERATFERAAHPELARDLQQRASELGGVRVSAFGPTATKGTSSASKADEPPKAAPAATTLGGPLSIDRVEIDGVEKTRPFELSEGLHQVRVLREGRLAWAGWVNAATDPLVVPVPSAAPCSEIDLAGMGATADGASPNPTVQCPRYAVARAATPGAIEVSVCFGHRCGPWLPWRREWGTTFEGPAHPPWPAPKSNSWILWTAAGVAAVAAGGLVLWQAGAFERSTPPHDSFVWVPPK